MTYKRPWRFPLALAALLASLATIAEQSPEPIDIDADNGRIDGRTGTYHLSGNVRITRGQLIVRADEGQGHRSNGQEMERIELSGSPTTWQDVLEDGEAIEGESDELIYDFVDGTITMLGNARIRNVQGRFSGSKLVYDLDTQSLVGDGGVSLTIEPATAESAARELQPEDEQAEPEDDESEDEADGSEPPV